VRNCQSGGKLGSTLGAAALEHETAATIRHAGTETVRTGALQYTGLKSSFHNAIRVVVLAAMGRF